MAAVAHGPLDYAVLVPLKLPQCDRSHDCPSVRLSVRLSQRGSVYAGDAALDRRRRRRRGRGALY